MMRYLIIATLLVMVLATGCRRRNFAEQQLVAQVGDEKLYVSDVAPIFKTPLLADDSLKLLEQYADAWVMRQLKIQQADRVLRDAEPEIDQMVEDYRISLLTHKLDQFHVDAKIDTALTDSELTEYYDANKGAFALDRNMVKGVIVRLPANHPRRTQVRTLMTAGGDRYQDFLELSLKNNFEVHEVSTWMDFSEFLRLLPTNSLRDYDDMLDKRGVQEMRDGEDLYLVTIRSSLRRGEPAPLEQVKEDIRRVILNQRRQEIIRAYENEMYQTALESKKLKLNINSR